MLCGSLLRFRRVRGWPSSEINLNQRQTEGGDQGTGDNANHAKDLYATDDRKEKKERMDVCLDSHNQRPEEVVHGADDEDPNGQKNDPFGCGSLNE